MIAAADSERQQQRRGQRLVMWRGAAAAWARTTGGASAGGAPVPAADAGAGGHVGAARLRAARAPRGAACAKSWEATISIWFSRGYQTCQSWPPGYTA